MIMESRIQTEKVRINSEVSQVGSIIQPHQAVLQEPCFRVQVLRCQDDERVSRATNLCAGIFQESEVYSEQITDNTLPLLALERFNQSIQKVSADMTKPIDEVNNIMPTITTSLQNIPSKRELRPHAQTMEDQMARMAQIEEVDTGLTTARIGDELLESAPYEFRTAVPRSSITQPDPCRSNIHPDRLLPFHERSISSLDNTGSASTQFGKIGGGAGGRDGDAVAGDGKAGTRDGNAGNGYGNDGAGELPGSPNPPPSDEGRPGG